MSRQNRAAMLPADSKEKALSLLGDAENEKFPIFMTGIFLEFISLNIFMSFEEASE